MLLILNTAQIIISVLLMITILMQRRGGGLSQVFGGEGGVYRTRRGLEKGVFISTIVLSILFLATALLHIILI